MDKLFLMLETCYILRSGKKILVLKNSYAYVIRKSNA